MKVLAVVKVWENYVPLTRKKKLKSTSWLSSMSVIWAPANLVHIHSNKLYWSIQVIHVYMPYYRGEMVPLHCMFKNMCTKKWKWETHKTGKNTFWSTTVKWNGNKQDKHLMKMDKWKQVSSTNILKLPRLNTRDCLLNHKNSGISATMKKVFI
jgi:hypothetical protein